MADFLNKEKAEGGPTNSDGNKKKSMNGLMRHYASYGSSKLLSHLNSLLQMLLKKQMMAQNGPLKN